MNKRQRLSELNRILEKLFDADRSAKDDYLLRERVTLETAIGAAAALAPRQRGRKAVGA